MATEVENLMLEHLRALRADVSEVKEGVHDLQVRMTSLEENTAAMNRWLDSMNLRTDLLSFDEIEVLLSAVRRGSEGMAKNAE